MVSFNLRFIIKVNGKVNGNVKIYNVYCCLLLSITVYYCLLLSTNSKTVLSSQPRDCVEFSQGYCCIYSERVFGSIDFLSPILERISYQM